MDHDHESLNSTVHETFKKYHVTEGGISTRQQQQQHQQQQQQQTSWVQRRRFIRTINGGHVFSICRKNSRWWRDGSRQGIPTRSCFGIVMSVVLSPVQHVVHALTRSAEDCDVCSARGDTPICLVRITVGFTHCALLSVKTQPRAFFSTASSIIQTRTLDIFHVQTHRSFPNGIFFAHVRGSFFHFRF